MKITTSQLRRIIQEESRRVLREAASPEVAEFREKLVGAEKALEDLKQSIKTMRTPGSILSQRMVANLDYNSHLGDLLGDISEQLDMIDTSTT